MCNCHFVICRKFSVSGNIYNIRDSIYNFATTIMGPQIYNFVWPIIMQLCSFKMLWIFYFIVSCITTFLMVMYKSREDELKESILPNDNKDHKPTSGEVIKIVCDKLHALSEKLAAKEHTLKESIKSTEKVLNDIDNKSVSMIEDRYRDLMIDLKKNLMKTEQEVKSLQDEVTSLSLRRENLKNDVLKQQEDYHKMLATFNKDLESNNGQPKCSNFKVPTTLRCTYTSDNHSRSTIRSKVDRL
ncbi:uncharacterized protein LOC107269454 isoform X2 [Cephus cinctus]|uniref:Uncharacterized protein LOC107269454 isoform X2 n=1 Tax=Cephus cinctus TaxID=211228 RepID=A0AAJ7W2Z8_CEPCN|nr:uncharacterized protein LOC107269454 isoform X2 [Cephus cinctus]